MLSGRRPGADLGHRRAGWHGVSFGGAAPLLPLPGRHQGHKAYLSARAHS